MNTGRAKFRVTCLTCEVGVHPGTTRPESIARSHVIDPTADFGDPNTMRPIERFYRGRGVDGSGRTFADTLAQSDESLETSHDWVQWVFPLPERSNAQPTSPILHPQDLVQFRTDEVLHALVLTAVDRFNRFLDSTEQWVRQKDHNHLRITRVLRFLTLINLPEPAHALYRKVGAKLASEGLLLERTDWYWRTALKPTAEAWPQEWASWAAQW